MTEKQIRYNFADFILRNQTNKATVRTMIEFASTFDGVLDLPEYYDNGPLIKECKKIMEEN